jgi:uncharacterized protein YndB with AHSA1/START domain
MTDRIEKSIELKAPVERVWRALTDSREFGSWFLAAIDGPFVPGEPSKGRMTYPGFEHLPWEARIEAMEEPRYFAFSWPPFYGDDHPADTSGDPWTLVEFRLEPTAAGTRLDVAESGFDKLPADRRELAFRSNEPGWTEQLGNIKRYVEA